MSRCALDVHSCAQTLTTCVGQAPSAAQARVGSPLFVHVVTSNELVQILPFTIVGAVQVWISYAYFEATPSDILVAEAELEDGETEAQHAERIASMRAAVSTGEWAEFEAAARNVYSRGFVRMRENEPDAKAEAALLLDEWLRFERGCKSQDDAAKARAVEAVEKKVRLLHCHFVMFHVQHCQQSRVVAHGA